MVDSVPRSVSSVLLVDWPSPDVPTTLREAGYAVFIKNGPGADDFAPARPEKVDLVYVHRPIGELPAIVEAASRLGAHTVWRESPSDEARGIVEAAGLRYVGQPYLPDAVRSLQR